ncbi:MAG: Uma2 family endonuclease [Caldilineaceae bacterium]
MTVLTLNLKQFVATSDEFFDLCQANPYLHLERTAEGEVIIMSPAGGETGSRNLSIGSQLWNWNERQRTGVAFDSSTGFHLPNGADRSPDAAWIRQERWDALTAEQKRKFPPLCPDFVVELRSPTDGIKTVREKMQEYIDNGARLGWLIDPETRSVEIYEPGEEVEILYDPERVFGDPLLPGFVLDMKRVWE